MILSFSVAKEKEHPGINILWTSIDSLWTMLRSTKFFPVKNLLVIFSASLLIAILNPFVCVSELSCKVVLIFLFG